MGVGALYSIGILPDFENADAYLVYVDQGGLGLPDRDYYLGEDERSVGIIDAYRAHVAAQLRNLGTRRGGGRRGGGRDLRVRAPARRPRR